MNVGIHNRGTLAAVILATTMTAAGLYGCGSRERLQDDHLRSGTASRSSLTRHAAGAMISAHAVAPRIHAHVVTPQHPAARRPHPLTLPRPGTERHAAPAGSVSKPHPAPAHTRHTPTLAQALTPAQTTPAHRYAARGLSAPKGRPRSQPAGAIPPAPTHVRPTSQARGPATTSTPAPTEHGQLSHGPNEAGNGTLSGIDSSNPCRYLTTVEAASALGAPSARAHEAPLGPTCVFTPKGQATASTLSVQAITLSRELQRMRDVSTTSVAGRRAYCGTLGQSLMLVPLSNYYVLEIAARCAAAKAMARAAIPRIES